MIFHAEVQITRVVTLCSKAGFQEINMGKVLILEGYHQILHHLPLEVIQQINGAHIKAHSLVIAFLLSTAYYNGKTRNAILLIINKLITKEHKLE